MKLLLSIVAVIIVANGGFDQISNVQEKFPLPAELDESSGIIFYNGKVISHNDSDGENQLMELDTISGEVTRTVTITNAENVDWEDIAHDENHIYIGDFGNNAGSRTNLRIYKVDKEEYSMSDEVTAETIDFSYADQVDFTPNLNSTEWDAETLISIDENNLLVVTKNWVDGVSKAYAIPKIPGSYAVEPLPSSLSSGGRITGGTYNLLTDKVYLIGYTPFLQPFVWACEGFDSLDIFSGENAQTTLDDLGFDQMEAITYVAPNRYFIASESFNAPPFMNYAKLVAFNTSDPVLAFTDHQEKSTEIYPNPVSDILSLDILDFNRVEIYDADFALVYSGNQKKVDVSRFASGVYLVKVIYADGSFSAEKVIKQ